MTEKQDCEFKSAKELGLSQKEWEALITILPLLEHDAIRHAPEASKQSKQSKHIKRDKPDPVFNMFTWREDLACGTAMCIGGSAEHFGKLGPGQLAQRANALARAGRDELYNLFYPPHIIMGWGKLTPQQAAIALRHYLKTGEDGGWDKACRK